MLALPAAAQQAVKVSFQPGGRVSVDATQATVRSILNEWAKQGGTKIMGADKVTGAQVTLKLVNVPEAQALETILRSVAGYMAAPAKVATGPSIYDRILIMATTSAPPPAAAASRPANNAGANNAFNGTQRFIPPRVAEQKEADDQDEPDDNPPNPPVFTFPQPGVQQQNGFPQGGFQPGLNQPGMVTTPSNGQPIVINPATPQPGYQPAMPVGVSQPGMMVAPPQQPQTTTPTTMIRPPGRNQ
jgi:hypothetical protein